MTPSRDHLRYTLWLRLARPLLLAWLLAAPLALAQFPASLNDTFQTTAAEFNLPRDLLVALAWTRSHLRHQASEIGEIGVMQLSPEQVSRAAMRLNESEAALQNDPQANIRGAATLLQEIVEQRYPNRAELAAAEWFEVITAFGYPDEPSAGHSHARQVFTVMAQGLTVTVEGEALEIAPWPEAAPLVAAPDVTITSEDYPAAHWVPANEANYTPAQRTAAEIDTIVIHTTEGSYAGVINWFSRPTKVSGHYVIRSSDGDITQMVRDHDIAWHAGHLATNNRSLGIEHEAFVNDPSWYTEAMYVASAKLVRHLAQKYNIPLDRQHIIAHNEVPGCPNPGGGGGSCHTDPGPHWDWDTFMALVTAGPVPPPVVTYTGAIQLQARTAHGGAILFVGNGSCAALQATAAFTPAATTGPAGQFTLTLPETAGERCLIAHHPSYLAARRLLPSSGPLGTMLLPAGDVKPDGQINILDLALISTHYNSANSASDLNADGLVNLLDLALAANNFGQNGPVEWLPQAE